MYCNHVVQSSSTSPDLSNALNPQKRSPSWVFLKSSWTSGERDISATHVIVQVAAMLKERC